MKVFELNTEEIQNLLPWIQDCEKNGFNWPWNIEQWREVNWDHHNFYILEEQNSPIGFSLFQSLPGNDSCHLLKIFILPHLHGQGKGKFLLLRSLEKENGNGKSSCFLEVETQNSHAVMLYESLGFVKMREIKNFYKNGAAALCYLKSWSS